MSSLIISEWSDKIMNMFFVHDLIKSVVRKYKLVHNFRSELKIMNMFFVHDIIKA